MWRCLEWTDLKRSTGFGKLGSSVPVLVCSGFGDADVEARFADKQIAGFFPKPYTMKQLAAKVKECIAPGDSDSG
jgi:hypothetical protein